MGAYGGLCLFDAAAFRTCVLPAFAGGERHPLIAATLDHVSVARPNSRLRLPAYRGLAELAPHYAADMSSCALGRHFTVCDGHLYLPPASAQAGAECWGYEDLVALFEWVVTRNVLCQPAVLGLRFNSLEQLFPEIAVLDEATRGLLLWLDSGNRYWASGTGGYGEGIHGWLDREQTAQLAAGLRTLPLEALLEHWSGDRAAAELHAARIEQFGDTLTRAVAAGQGVLWGRDLLIFYEHGRWLSSPTPRLPA